MRNLKLIYSRHNFTSPAQAITPQIAPYCELTLVLRGRLEYVVDGRQISLDEGDAVFIKTGQTRARKKHDTLGDYVSFNFETQDSINLPTLIKSAVHSEEHLLIAALDKMSGRYFPDNEEKIGHLVGCLLALMEDRIKMQNYSSLSRSIMSYLNKNYASRITLSDVAATTYFSPIYCDTVFRREVGRSIIDFLIDKRIEEAKKLLIGNLHKLSEISTLVGFNDYNYFARVFKKRTGYTPLSYRKMMLKY
jgi:YesN/AraC family two-component response regulator